MLDEQLLNIVYNFDHQMSLSKSKYWYANNGLYRPLDGVKNFKYKLLYFLTPNKKI